MITRRRFATAATSLPLAGLATLPTAAAETTGFRFVHLTDMHVQPERGAPDGFKQCLRAINALDPKPDFVITGGDLINDALHVDEERAALEWKLFDECMKVLEVPAWHTIGNHDIGGWSSRAKMKEASPYFGKRWFAEHYGKGKTYQSFDHKGWHFIILDTQAQQVDVPDYRGWLDDEQHEWLKADLKATGTSTPIVMVSHIPFHTALHQLAADPTKAPLGQYAVVNNFHTFRRLITGYNIQVILSGHGHLRERIDLAGLRHIQSGAVSGLWWKGPVYGDAEAFNVIDCGATDFEYSFETFGWKVRPE